MFSSGARGGPAAGHAPRSPRRSRLARAPAVSGGGGSGRQQQVVGEQLPPLLELRAALARISELVDHAREAYRAGGDDLLVSQPVSGGRRELVRRSLGIRTQGLRRDRLAGDRRGVVGGGLFGRRGLVEETGTTTSANTPGDKPLCDLDDEGKRGSVSTEDAVKSFEDASLEDQQIVQPQSVRFVPFHRDDEAELIELLRRTAELVVHGERGASALLERSEKDTEGDDNMAKYDAHQAVFECFCERKGLQTIVNITTGEAFQFLDEKEGNGGNDPKTGGSVSVDTEKQYEKSDAGLSFTAEGDTILLPPMSVATQAVQTVSILIQNVVRIQSLYFLLSNDRVNDLINLPLDLYQMAEDEANRSAQSESRRRLLRKGSAQPRTEIAELTTYFVNFMKSLALRMNEETLQFFLSYEAKATADRGTPNVESMDSEISPGIESDGNTPISPVAASGEGSTVLYELDVSKVKFPLYARALEFCSGDEDPFVRTTAMNICLNTLRLSTMSDDVDEKEPGSQQSLGFKSPDAKLHDSPALPIRERGAIAQYVCFPGRVESLISPIFMKLARLCDSLTEAIRALDDLEMKRRGYVKIMNSVRLKDRSGVKESERRGSAEDHNAESIVQELTKMEGMRHRLCDSFHDISADLQDELLLLEDLLHVGLTSINEQIIELMLATFIYPLLLQPLSLFSQRTDQPPSLDANDKVGPTRVESPRGTDFGKPPDTTSILTHSGLLDVSDSGEQSMNQDTDSNIEFVASVPDTAPAKAALFLSAAVFHTITNKPLLNLLLTAIFHPLAPDNGEDFVVKAKPEVIVSNVKSGRVRIRVDSERTKTYSFGQSRSQSDANVNAGDSCVFILAPALANVFGNIFTENSEAVSMKTRENPYRHIVLGCIGGKEGTSALQNLAVFVADAALSAVENSYASSIILGSSTKPNVEAISSLSRSLMTMSLSPNGVWNIDCNLVATNALLQATLGNEGARMAANKIVEDRVGYARSCVAQIPSRIENVMHGKESNEYRRHAILDRIFFDRLLAKNKNLLECFAKSGKIETKAESRGGDEVLDEDDGINFCVPVAMKSSLNDVRAHICRAPTDLSFGFDSKVPLRQGALSVIAYLRLDTFRNYFMTSAAKDQTKLATYGKLESPPDGRSRGGDYDDDDEVSYDGCKHPDRCLYGTVESALTTTLMQGQKLGDGSLDGNDAPKTGSIVGLVGRAAFPCVCEVYPESAPLFTDRGACVVADGIRWQSLYMVVLGKFMVLAEPERGGSGGNGRIISSSRLASLQIERDAPPGQGNKSPARRLHLTYSSLDLKPPNIFAADETPSIGMRRNSVVLNRSRLDLWFEDETAAGQTLRVLLAKIAKARAGRGDKIRHVMLRST